MSLFSLPLHLRYLWWFVLDLLVARGAVTVDCYHYGLDFPSSTQSVLNVFFCDSAKGIEWICSGTSVRSKSQ